MCILFICTGSSSLNGYKLILASNRDEYFFRPAKAASVWKDGNVIGGQDMQPGREGGTWLAINGQKKRLGVLLNLPNVPTTANAQGRGSIVSDFVLGDMTINKYVTQLEESEYNSNGYNPFILVTVDIGNTTQLTSYSNFDKKLGSYKNDCAVGFSNSIPGTSLKKAVFGEERFQQIINKNLSKDKLVDELLSLLKWDKKHLPDPELAKRALSSDDLASIFVHIPNQEYGTRTHTIILVDAEGNLDFYEWTKIPEQTDWLKTHLQDKVPIN